MPGDGKRQEQRDQEAAVRDLMARRLRQRSDQPVKRPALVNPSFDEVGRERCRQINRAGILRNK